MPATQADVAAHAGVTVMTLSRYFRTPEKVGRDTRERIAAAIADLGYVRDATAARLAGKARPMICVIVPSLGLPYATDAFAAISMAAEARGAAVMVSETQFDPVRQEALIEDALSWRPTGIVHLADTASEQSRKMIAANSVRFVEAGSFNADPVDISIGVSSFDAAEALSRAVFAAYRGPVGFALRRSGYDLEREREAGYRAACAAFGQAPVVLEESARYSPFEAGARLLRRAIAHEALRAVIFAGDYIATGALLEAQRTGRKVPGDLAICGMGNYQIAAYTVPSLTTVDLPTQRIAEIAVEACFKELSSYKLDAKLIERESCRLLI